MNLILQYIVFALCILMFEVKREWKIAILFFAQMCLIDVVIQFTAFGVSQIILNICFLLSELPNWNKHYHSIRKTIIWTLLLIQLTAIILLIINSPHYIDNPANWIRLIIKEIISKYLVLAYAFISIKNVKTLKPLLIMSYVGILFLTLFGIVNFITHHADFVDIIYSNNNIKLNSVTEKLGSKFSDSERFRVQSMFFNPFCYGYICMITLMLWIVAYLKKQQPKLRFLIVVACSIFGIISCGCRTVILCSIIGIMSFFLFSFSWRKKVKYTIITILIAFLAYSSMAPVQEVINKTLTVFSDESGNQVSGSNINMREIQYMRVFYYIKNHLLFGRGKDFFLIDLGFSGGADTLIDTDLYGLEGVVMAFLLERGIIGVLFWTIFYILLIIYFYRKRKSDNLYAGTGIALIIIYLAFSNMTGELHSVAPTLLLIGVMMKLIACSPFQQKSLKSN